MTVVILLIVLGLAFIISGLREKDSPRWSFHASSREKEDDDITACDINAIRRSGRYSAAERAAEYGRRGKSPSGVIDGVYNDAYRANNSYNDSHRDWDAGA